MDLNTVYIKIEFNNEINGYIFDISNSRLDTRLTISVLDFVILNYQRYNIKHVNISNNNFELKSSLGLELLNKILYCYTTLHIGINASNGLQQDDNVENYNFLEEEKAFMNNYGVYI